MLSSAFQHTIKTPFTVEGVGVHSGAPARLTVKPAGSYQGISFIRTDILDRDNVIPAKWDSVTETRLCTVLTNAEGVSVSTVEHVLSAFAALGLDNAVVEIDGPEIPIMDGSAADFVIAIDRAGLTPQQAKRRAIRIKKTVTFRDGDKEAVLSPLLANQAPSAAAQAVFDFDIAFDSALIGQQHFSHGLTEAAYRNDIASARTFGFLHEVEALRKMGLARGGSLDNAIVIGKDAQGADTVMNPGGLRFETEFVRHKILDAIGDLYLAGLQIIGKYHGIKAGHAMNNRILHALFADPAAYEIVDYVQTPARAAAPRRQACPVYAGDDDACASQHV